MLVNFIVWKINFTLFPTKENFQFCKIFSVYKKLSLESYFSLAPFPFFHSSRWQVITKTDNFYKDHNMLFNLQCSYRFSLPSWSPKRVSNHLLRHLFTSYLENIIIYWLYIYIKPNVHHTGTQVFNSTAAIFTKYMLYKLEIYSLPVTNKRKLF